MKQCSKIVRAMSVVLLAAALVVAGVLGGTEVKTSAKTKASLKKPIAATKKKKITVKDEAEYALSDFINCYGKGKADKKVRLIQLSLR